MNEHARTHTHTHTHTPLLFPTTQGPEQSLVIVMKTQAVVNSVNQKNNWLGLPAGFLCSSAGP